MAELKRLPYLEARTWILHALIVGGISMTSAAARVALVDQAELDGAKCPDVENPDPHWLVNDR